MIDAGDIHLEWDESGLELTIDGSETFLVTDPEQLYRKVVAEIGPWLADMEAARREFEATGGGPPPERIEDASESYDRDAFWKGRA